MKGRLFSILAVLAFACAVVAGCSNPAHAQGDIPLTSASTCHYNDPAQSGQGLDLRVYDATDVAPARVFGTLYVGAIPAYYRYAPSWFSVQGSLAAGDGNSQTLPVYQAGDVVLGEGNVPVPIVVGHVRLTATSNSALAAELTLDIQSGFSPPEPTINVPFAFRCLAR